MAEAINRVLVGRQIGAYKITSLLGAGGMGEVYRAEDTRLGRTVAVKVLPTEMAQDKERLSRFVREARAASALNHANVAHIYEIGQSDGLHFIAMEYVEGQTLADKIGGRPLPIGEIVDIGIQVADALDEAHRKGITHRDIKQANVMLTARGQVKILDFGLAKVTQPEGQAIGSDISTVMKTETGVVMGTMHYMSPEQVLGRDVDHRTDIFSLGVVLYEMTTGRLPFTGTSSSETMDRILHSQPDAIARFNYNVPGELERIIRKCLEKDRERRYQSARDVFIDLKNFNDSGAHHPAVVSSRPRFKAAISIAAVVVVLLCLAGLYWFNRPGSPTDSIAILPFVNAGGNPDTEYLADGITDTLINSLSRVPNLTVTSRTSVFRYKGREPDAQTAGEKLKVQAVVTGRVVQRGDGLSISAELTDVRSNRHLWGEQYNRKLMDILAVQEEIATEISEKLRFKLTGEDKLRLTKRYTQNSEAYQLYLLGRYHWLKKTPDGFNKGIEYFQKAIEKDQNYAPAYAGLAACYNNLANWNFALMPPREAWAKAKAAAEKALRIDDELASAHASLALVAYTWEWDWSRAEKEFKRALELDPGSSSTYDPSPSSTYHWYSHYLMTMGRTEDSFRAFRRALELDPVDTANTSHQGWHYLYIRQYDRAIEPLQKTIEMNPTFLPAQWYLGLAFEQKGAFQDAITQFQNCARITAGRPSMLALLGHAYAAASRRSEAEAILQQLSVLSKQRYVPSYPIATIYAALGQKEEAFSWLEKAYEERDSWMDYLGLDPRLDGLHSDPRFADLLRRMNLVR